MSYLNSEVITLLNNFAKTQIALQIPDLPLSKSNPNLGTSIESAIEGAVAASEAYVAGTPSDWATPAPTTVKSAIDRIANALFLGHTSGAIP